MKKFVLFIAVFSLIKFSVAQSERYQKTMEQNIAALDTTRTVDGWRDLRNSFQRIADAEKTQWLPYYYAALANIWRGFFRPNGTLACPMPLSPQHFTPSSSNAQV